MQAPQGEEGSGREGLDGATSDRVRSTLGGQGEGRGGEQRVGLQREADHEKGEEKGERLNRVGSEKVRIGEGTRGRSAVIERQDLTASVADSAVLNLHRQTRSSREEAGRRTPKGKEGVVKEGSNQ